MVSTLTGAVIPSLFLPLMISQNALACMSIIFMSYVSYIDIIMEFVMCFYPGFHHRSHAVCSYIVVDNQKNHSTSVLSGVSQGTVLVAITIIFDLYIAK